MTAAWNSLSPAGQILAACIATFVVGLIAAMALVTAGIYLLVRLDRRHPRTEWESVVQAVTEGRADFWTPQALDRLRVAMENPHALDDPSTEYDFAAWKRELSDERGRRG